MNSRFKQVCIRLLAADHDVLGSIDFDSICVECGADPKRLNNMFYDIFGMSGDELIDHYRHGG